MLKEQKREKNQAHNPTKSSGDKEKDPFLIFEPRDDSNKAKMPFFKSTGRNTNHIQYFRNNTPGTVMSHGILKPFG